MSRIALYRKYRSGDFTDVIGQEHVTRTLEAAVKRSMVGHAYLLTGPRGTGKTSIARILARRVNELPPEADLDKELDIIEIDAASNRGIDEIRSLREKIVSAPTSLRYKVYIIDEVHMLTREAFNALLKTLEEPPQHAIFVLATTEAHKLPETIVSRTQRFDLRPITETDLTNRLATIAQAEGLTVEPAALAMIARASRGGFRDAIGLLDQLSVIGEDIAASHVAAILGMAGQEDVDSLIAEILDRNTAAALKRLNSLIAAGNDPTSITRQLLDAARIMLLKNGSEVAPSDGKDSFADEIVRLIESLVRALEDFKSSGHYSLPLELAVYKASTIRRGESLYSEEPLHQDIPASTQTIPSSSVVKKTQGRKASAAKPTSANTSQNSDEDTNLCLKGLSMIKERNNSLFAVMKSANPRIEGDSLILDCRFNFHKERIEEQKNRQMVEQIMSKALGRDIILSCRLETASNQRVTDPEHELVASALEILGGEVING